MTPVIIQDAKQEKKDVNVNILRVNMLFFRDSFCFHSWFQPSLEQGGHSGLALFSPASNKQLIFTT